MPVQRQRSDPSAAADRPSPFLKWAGGKGQLVSRFLPLFPTQFSRFYEPFLGGGAVYLALQPPVAKLSDLNGDLIHCWEIVRDHPAALMKSLDKHEFGSEYYYRLRAIQPEALGPVERASRLIYLNKTCYNGLYRVNRDGRFNVPFGSYERPPRLYDRHNLLRISEGLHGVELTRASFDDAVSDAHDGDFVYFDPPYHPLSKTANFTSYTEDSFSKRDQEKLADTVHELHGRGCLVAVSNSDTPEIRRLYRGFRFQALLATRAINSKGSRRGKIPELLIYNYERRVVRAKGTERGKDNARRQFGSEVRQGS